MMRLRQDRGRRRVCGMGGQRVRIALQVGLTARTALIVTAAAGILLAPLGSVAALAACAGDCDDSAHVTIHEVITAVAIALKNAPVAQCRAADTDGDDTVTINEIMRVIDRARGGCFLWRQDSAILSYSTCHPDVTGIVQDSIAGGEFDCTYQGHVSGNTVLMREHCQGETEPSPPFTATIDPTGRVTAVLTETESFEDCVVTIRGTLSAVTDSSPTTATNVFMFQFSRSCGYGNCTVSVQTRWRHGGP